MRGRKPTPVALKLLRGNPGRRPIPDTVPQPDPGIPEPPAILSGEALLEWTRLTKELSAAGLLCNLDRGHLSAYCQSWARWLEAERQIAELGTVIKSPSGYPIISPYLSIANKAHEQFTKIGLEFGLTASSRNRVSMIKPESESIMVRDRNAAKRRFFDGGKPDEFQDFLDRRDARDAAKFTQPTEKAE